MLEASKAIWLDNDGYWDFSDDGVVHIALAGTNALTEIVDSMRMERGHLPMLPVGHNDYDPVGWYNFYIDLTYVSKTHVSSTILAIVDSSVAEDDFKSYDIPLTEAEQLEVYHELDKQFKERFGTSCEELLRSSVSFLEENA